MSSHSGHQAPAADSTAPQRSWLTQFFRKRPYRWAILGVAGCFTTLGVVFASKTGHDPIAEISRHIGIFLLASVVVHLTYDMVLREEINDYLIVELEKRIDLLHDRFEQQAKDFIGTLSTNATVAFDNGVSKLYSKDAKYKEDHPFKMEIATCESVRSIARTFGKLFSGDVAVSIVDAMADGCHFRFAMLSNKAANSDMRSLLSMNPEDIPTAYSGLLNVEAEYLSRVNTGKKIRGTLELRVHELFLPYSTLEYERRKGLPTAFPPADLFCDHFFDADTKSVCGFAWSGPLAAKLRKRADMIWNGSEPAYKLQGNMVLRKDSNRNGLHEDGNLDLNGLIADFYERAHEFAKRKESMANITGS